MSGGDSPGPYGYFFQLLLDVKVRRTGEGWLTLGQGWGRGLEGQAQEGHGDCQHRHPLWSQSSRKGNGVRQGGRRGREGRAWVLGDPREPLKQPAHPLGASALLKACSLLSQDSTIHAKCVATPGKSLARDQQRTAGKLAKHNTQMPNKHPAPYVPLHTRVCSVPGTWKTLSRCWLRRHGEATTKTQLCASVGRNEPAHSPPTGRNYQSIL